MSLYIFNATKCTQEVCYRIPGVARSFMTKIAAGEQAEIYREGTRDDHDQIVRQLEPFGLAQAAELNRVNGFIGLVYQFDKPIKAEKIVPVYQHNDEVRAKEARDARKIAFAATDEALSRAAQETGEKYQEVEVTLNEEESKGNTPQVAEVYELETPHRGRGRPRKAR